jgi:CBS domain-containing protein
MTGDVISARPSASIREAAFAMSEHQCSCLVVVGGDIPLGVLTKRDLVRVVAGANGTASASETAVSHVMSTPAVTVRDTCSVFEALVICESRRIRHLPVVDAAGRLR